MLHRVMALPADVRARYSTSTLRAVLSGARRCARSWPSASGPSTARSC
ncbi:hypothetical protein ACFQV2_23995 [Actinokineospora soli]|uniref:Uncharacterized protein n=1 Tax=Actinokineospora soli TaxID=1048753 RepID=A0ABW2TQL2_9PSEU